MGAAMAAVSPAHADSYLDFRADSSYTKSARHSCWAVACPLISDISNDGHYTLQRGGSPGQQYVLTLR